MKKTNRVLDHPTYGKLILTDHLVKRAIQRLGFGHDSYNFTVHFLKNGLLNCQEVTGWKNGLGTWKVGCEKDTVYVSFGENWVLPMVIKNDKLYIVKSIFPSKRITKK
jgi:hypothetical protein